MELETLNYQSTKPTCIKAGSIVVPRGSSRSTTLDVSDHPHRELSVWKIFIKSTKINNSHYSSQPAWSGQNLIEPRFNSRFYERKRIEPQLNLQYRAPVGVILPTFDLRLLTLDYPNQKVVVCLDLNYKIEANTRTSSHILLKSCHLLNFNLHFQPMFIDTQHIKLYSAIVHYHQPATPATPGNWQSFFSAKVSRRN